MNPRVTLKDVAMRAGVSYQTVSKVLNGQANVALETKELIWQVVRELGYTTNVTARSLRKSASGLIGYSWTPEPPGQVNPILDLFLSSAVTSAEEQGYHVMLFPNGSRPDQTQAYRTLIGAGRVDGFVITSTDYTDSRVALLQELNFPFVVFGRTNPHGPFAYVDVDGCAGMASAVEHLIEQEHRKIAFLGWPAESRVGEDRLSGYLQATAAHGLAIHPQWICRGEGTVDAGYRLTSTLLAMTGDSRPTAVVAVDDRLAIGAMQAAQEVGLQVGVEFAVTGFDDTPGIQNLTPPLTSLRQPIWTVGQTIMPMLIELIQGRKPATLQTILPPKLIPRPSSLRK